LSTQGPNPFEGVPANGMRGAVRPAAAAATFASRIAAVQQAQWNNGSNGPGRPVSTEPWYCSAVVLAYVSQSRAHRREYIC